LAAIDVVLPLASTQAESSNAQFEADKDTKFIEWIQHIHKKFHDILHKSNAKSKQRDDQHRVPHKFQVGDKVWVSGGRQGLVAFAERVPYRPHQKLHPLRYGPYTITNIVGENPSELSIPPFLGLHPVFNVDLLQPYFPPLLDTSDITEQLKPIELDPDFTRRKK
jgi:hypothetical protein